MLDNADRTMRDALLAATRMEAATATMRSEVYEVRSSRRSTLSTVDLAAVAKEDLLAAAASAISGVSSSTPDARAVSFAQRISGRKVSQVDSLLEAQRAQDHVTKGDDAVERAHFSATSAERAIAARQLGELRIQLEEQQRQMQEEMQAQVRAAIEEAQQSKKKMVTSSMRSMKDQAVLGNKLQAAQVYIYIYGRPGPTLASTVGELS